jgi:hypothetical protein
MIHSRTFNEGILYHEVVNTTTQKLSLTIQLRSLRCTFHHTKRRFLLVLFPAPKKKLKCHAAIQSLMGYVLKYSRDLVLATFLS